VCEIAGYSSEAQRYRPAVPTLR